MGLSSAEMLRQERSPRQQLRDAIFAVNPSGTITDSETGHKIYIDDLLKTSDGAHGRLDAKVISPLPTTPISGLLPHNDLVPVTTNPMYTSMQYDSPGTPEGRLLPVPPTTVQDSLSHQSAKEHADNSDSEDNNLVSFVNLYDQLRAVTKEAVATALGDDIFTDVKISDESLELVLSCALLLDQYSPDGIRPEHLGMVIDLPDPSSSIATRYLDTTDRSMQMLDVAFRLLNLKEEHTSELQVPLGDPARIRVQDAVLNLLDPKNDLLTHADEVNQDQMRAGFAMAREDIRFTHVRRFRTLEMMKEPALPLRDTMNAAGAKLKYVLDVLDALAAGKTDEIIGDVADQIIDAFGGINLSDLRRRVQNAYNDVVVEPEYKDIGTRSLNVVNALLQRLKKTYPNDRQKALDWNAMQNDVINEIFSFSHRDNLTPNSLARKYVVSADRALINIEMAAYFLSGDQTILNEKEQEEFAIELLGTEGTTAESPLQQARLLIHDATQAIDYIPENMDTLLTVEEVQFDEEALSKALYPQTAVTPSVSTVNKNKIQNLQFGSDGYVIRESAVVDFPPTLGPDEIAFAYQNTQGSTEWVIFAGPTVDQYGNLRRDTEGNVIMRSPDNNVALMNYYADQRNRDFERQKGTKRLHVMVPSKIATTPRE